jgi:hypothetical protein
MPNIMEAITVVAPTARRIKAAATEHFIMEVITAAGGTLSQSIIIITRAYITLMAAPTTTRP